MIQTIEILNTNVNATGSIFTNNTSVGGFQATLAGTGVISSAVTIHGSLDKTNWMNIGTLNVSDTILSTGLSAVSNWIFYRASAVAVPGIGTINSIRVNMAVVT